MMTTGFKIDRHQPIKRLTTYNLHCRKCHPGVEMDFFQHLQLKYKFWAVNTVTFISTMLLVLVALWVEQDRIHVERQQLARELVTLASTDRAPAGLRWLDAAGNAARTTSTATWIPGEALTTHAAVPLHGAWAVQHEGQPRLLAVDQQHYL